MPAFRLRICVHVRPAGPRDDAVLARFFAAYHEEFRHELGDQDVTAEGRRARARYAEGALLVAEEDGATVGCVAFEPWGPARARMKRMYVPPSHRGRGVGRALAVAIIDAARQAGHTSMVLDTTEPMQAATGLYRSLGFEPFAPDYVAPCVGTVYLAMHL